MRVKKFVARTLPEALVQAKAELGPDAVILQTSEMTVGGLFGLFGRRMIQVMAAVDEPALPVRGQGLPRGGSRENGAANLPEDVVKAIGGAAAPAAKAEANGAALPSQEAAAAESPPETDASSEGRAERAAPAPSGAETAARSRPVADPAPGSAGAPGLAGGPDLAAVREEMAAMKAMLGRLMEQAHFTAPQGLEPELAAVLRSLLSSGVVEEEAWGLVGRVRERIAAGKAAMEDAAEQVRQLIAADLGEVRPIGLDRRLVVMVGPTGVGKTTTLAKLAAHFALEGQKKVGLLTADTYRIAAVEQLRTYSDILGLPLEVVYDPAEVEQALTRLEGRELILVDVAGRSPRNSAHMAELKAFLEAFGPAEVYLVMSLTSGYRDALTIVENYLPVGFDRFLFTKWDETVTPGLIYNLVRKYGRPLSYITTGQSVPDDIEQAEPAKIARAIVGD